MQLKQDDDEDGEGGWAIFEFIAQLFIGLLSLFGD